MGRGRTCSRAGETEGWRVEEREEGGLRREGRRVEEGRQAGGEKWSQVGAKDER